MKDTTFKFNKKIKVISIILCVALIALLGWNVHSDNIKAKHMESVEVATYTLQQERLELQKSLTQLEKEYQIKINGKATLTFVFTELTEQIYTNVYPRMHEYGYFGILALSKENFPDASGCMTSAQFKELLENGWTVCLAWNGNTAGISDDNIKSDASREDVDVMSEWLLEMKELLNGLGLEMPKQVYFERETYQTEYDEILSEYGISAVIHHQEENLPLLTTKTEEGIWHIGAWGWNQVNAKKNLNQAMEDGAGLVFKLGNDYYYNESQFEKMLATVAGYEIEENLFVTDIATAYDYRGQAEDEQDNLKDELAARLEEVEQEITRIDEEVKEIYRKYGIE